MTKLIIQKTLVAGLVIVGVLATTLNAIAITADEKKVFKTTFIQQCSESCPTEMKKVLDASMPGYKPVDLDYYSQKCKDTCQCDLDNMDKYVSDSLMDGAIDAQVSSKNADQDPKMKSFLGQIEVLSQDCANFVFQAKPLPNPAPFK